MNVNKKNVECLTITEELSGQRIDNFLRRYLKNIPPSHLYRLMRKGEIRLNKKRTHFSTHLNTGDLLRLPPLFLNETEKKNIVFPHLHFPILFEDEDLLVINKPYGIAVHAGSGVEYGIIEILRKQRKDLNFLELAHRLDKETSGVLVLAKKNAVLKKMYSVFKEKKLKKNYLVLTHGNFLENKINVHLPLYKTVNALGEHFVKVDVQNGKEAHSIFRLIARWENLSLLNAQILTGRTHQIRVHLNHLGFPVLNDEKYGDFKENKKIKSLKRMALHAYSLILPHKENQKLILKAPLEESLRQFIVNLKEPLFQTEFFKEIQNEKA